jgi:hypothetical protein
LPTISSGPGAGTPNGRDGGAPSVSRQTLTETADAFVLGGLSGAIRCPKETVLSFHLQTTKAADV